VSGIQRLAEMTRDEVRMASEDAVIVIPVGSIEQHGPHLPLATDTLLAEAVLADATRLLEADGDVPLVLAPTLPVGSSPHHLFAAAMSLQPTTLLSVLNDVLESLITSGFTRLFILNGHGGNEECVQLAVKEVVLRHPVAAAACSYWALGGTGSHVRPEITPGHAGWFETSLMLASNPELVRRDRLPSKAVQPDALFTRRSCPGLKIQLAGEWARIDGVTDASAEATERDGLGILADRGQQLAAALRFFHQQTESLIGNTNS
jgi:creatinine amidohydrolase